MMLSLEATDTFERVQGVECRVWKGTSGTGVPVHAWIPVIQPQTHDTAQLIVFDLELRSLPKARRELVSFDIRMAT